jgi:hypothetical protein
MPVKRCMIANILINSLCLLDVGLSGFLALPCLALHANAAMLELNMKDMRQCMKTASLILPVRHGS